MLSLSFLYEDPTPYKCSVRQRYQLDTRGMPETSGAIIME